MGTMCGQEIATSITLLNEQVLHNILKFGASKQLFEASTTVTPAAAWARADAFLFKVTYKFTGAYK